MQQKIINMERVQDYNENLGVETLHPLVSVVDMSELSVIKHSRKYFGFYLVILKQMECGMLHYGRSEYDYGDGTLVCVAPGQVAGADDGGSTVNPKGWILMFHPEFLRGTSLAKVMRDYSFFSYKSNEALHTSEEERQIIIGCMQAIRAELQHPTSIHCKRIIASNIELLLNHCARFYDRQFVSRELLNHDVLKRFEELLIKYFETPELCQAELPTVEWFADKLFLSANYFGDLVKRETSISPQKHIQRYIIERAKYLLVDENMTISQTAYTLGYKYPHHLSRMFKRETGVSPNDYKMQNKTIC